MWFSKTFTEISNRVSQATGRPATFAAAVAIIILWAVTGPVFHFSDTWQLIVNTGTTIVTFLMVFLIQNTQNRDGAAIQAKLDELIRASAAQNVFIGIEHLTQDELDEIRAHCEAKARAETAANQAEDHANRKAAKAAEKATS
ncbi:low affinity iron permease family protein [Microvirga subterranea]|uniref:Low affinity Fe/Cu permease n=1 Tax=Microvirga subterranea TaxID=186651 RepID=A0A370HGS3_9HYPH|nr:low affinity iron permease family protein [Microvirga subterranea]RDI56667.1 low affinity Fe/Cu permease [Microvirga subterranea]